MEDILLVETVVPDVRAPVEHSAVPSVREVTLNIINIRVLVKRYIVIDISAWVEHSAVPSVRKVKGNLFFPNLFFLPFTYRDRYRYSEITRAGGVRNWDWLRLEHCSW